MVLEKNKDLNNEHNKNKPLNIAINGNFLRVKLSGSMLKLSSLYGIKKLWVQFLIITLVSLISGVFGVFFLQNTGLYNVGFEAFSQGIARLASFLIQGPLELKLSIMNTLFWLLNIVVNIPLIFFGWYKIGKKFTLFSTYFIVISSLFGLFLGYIPGIENVFVFATVVPLDVFKENGVQIALWNSQHDTIVQLSLFIYGFVYGLIQAICYATLFILGTSSGGLDFIVVWYAEKKYKNLGTVFTYFNILCFIISYIIGSYIPASLTIIRFPDQVVDVGNTVIENSHLTSAWSLDLFFSPNFVATLAMSIVLGMTLNVFFPKYQMTKVEIVSRYASEIRDYLISKNKPYSLSIKTIEGGYSRLPQKMLITNCMFVDAANLLRIVRKYDPNALFVVSLVKTIDGYIYVATKKEENFSFKHSFDWFKKIITKKQDLTELHQIEFETENELDENNKNIDSKINVIEASEVYDETLNRIDNQKQPPSAKKTQKTKSTKTNNKTKK